MKTLKAKTNKQKRTQIFLDKIRVLDKTTQLKMLTEVREIFSDNRSMCVRYTNCAFDVSFIDQYIKELIKDLSKKVA